MGPNPGAHRAIFWAAGVLACAACGSSSDKGGAGGGDSGTDAATDGHTTTGTDGGGGVDAASGGDAHAETGSSSGSDAAAEAGDAGSTTAPPLVMYSNGVVDTTRWPASDDYSYGSGSPPDDYKDTTSPQAGHQYDLLVKAASGWQQATDWGDSPPNGVDISRYTKLRFDIDPPAGSAIAFFAHSTRSTGDDLQLNTAVDDLQTVPGVGAFKAGSWNTGVEVPLCYVGLSSSFNYYKFAMQNNGTGNAAFYLDNIEFVAGNTAWIYDGDPGAPGLASGWTDASSHATADYAFAPGTIRTDVYSDNNPPQASAFQGTVAGTTLSVASLTGNIVTGEHLVRFSGAPALWGTLASGSGTTWTLDGPGGDYASASSATAWLESDVHILELTTSATGGTWRASYAGGFDLTPYTDFTFAASPTQNGNSYEIQGYDTSGNAAGTAVSIAPGSLTYTNADRGVSPSGASFYTVYAVPLTALGLTGAKLGGISIKDTTSSAANTIYLSAIGFFS